MIGIIFYYPFSNNFSDVWHNLLTPRLLLDIVNSCPPLLRQLLQHCRRRLTQPPKSLDTSMAINISVSPLLCMRRRPQSTCATSLAATRRWGIAHFPHARHVTSSVVQTLVDIDYLGQRSHPVYSLRVCRCCWSFVLLKQKSFGKQITLMSKHQGNEREKIRLNCFWDGRSLLPV